ncbi:FG-GAP-like repeat-containing protein [Leptospira andrefontaineae]|uniref:VCBS repeat-containing protein n=1 Tax=Leptospira andrefontaineae TaxID=2484976 RepID=A0A4R9GXP8_9LEPT|nr:FG-GAP-like repeat-containing protein [Leptospira andrefontaineae]TGK36697.1 VCBS repeat-containing protein [Leptospira andrefontaineae]
MRKFLKKGIPYGIAVLLLFFLESCSFKSMDLAFEAMLEAQMACLVAGDTCVDASTTPPTGDVTAPTVTITNLPASGRPTVETGFLFGTSSDDTLVSVVQISIDGGTYTAATGTTSWSFALPTGSSTWRHGSFHSINIRSVDSSTNISTVLSLNIRKGYNRDLNGDGYADVVVMAPGDASGMGVAYIFNGGASGISATTSSAAGHSITGQGRMGYASAMGDVNGDGFGDLAIGASDYSGLQGITYVFHGSTSGITTNTASSADRILTYTGSNEFGYAIALGDVNGDGYDDLANGAYHIPLAFIYYSTGPGGISSTSGTSISGPGGSNFACGIGLGDINGDGFSDLIVGGNAFGGGGNTGGVWIFHSSGSAGVTVNSYTLANTTITGETAGNFGIRISTGDVNGDGYADLAVGAPQYNSYYGRSYVFNSTGTTSGITVSAAASANTIINAFSVSAVGLAVALGDVNGDGYDDFATGAPSYSTSQGRVYINLSDGSQVSAGSINLISGQSANQAFGNAVMISDINGDGLGDLVAGAYVYPDGIALSGRVYIFHSFGSGYSATAASSANTIISGGTGSEFGSNLVDANVPKDLYPKFLGVWAFGSLETYRIQI